jgi:hypothetical protein
MDRRAATNGFGEDKNILGLTGFERATDFMYSQKLVYSA